MHDVPLCTLEELRHNSPRFRFGKQWNRLARAQRFHLLGVPPNPSRSRCAHSSQPDGCLLRLRCSLLELYLGQFKQYRSRLYSYFRKAYPSLRRASPVRASALRLRFSRGSTIIAVIPLVSPACPTLIGGSERALAPIFGGHGSRRLMYPLFRYDRREVGVCQGADEG